MMTPTANKKNPKSDADRRLRQADRLARVMRVLELVSGRGRWTAGSLAQKLECNERTIHRDLQALLLAGVGVEFDRRAQCYRVRPGFSFPTIELTSDELIGQATAVALASAPGVAIGKGAKRTLEKLSEATSDPGQQSVLADAERLIHVLDLKLADHSRHQKIIHTIQFALLKGNQIRGKYQSPYQDKLIDLTLHPYRLCLVQQAWYLIARSTTLDEPRTYRVARFQTLRPLGHAAEIPDDFELKTYFANAWGVYRGSATHEVELLFTPDAAPLVTETRWHATQSVEKSSDGSVLLRFRVDGLEEILWWILGWCGRVRVLNPPQLRQMVIEQLEKAVAMNAGTGEPSVRPKPSTPSKRVVKS